MSFGPPPSVYTQSTLAADKARQRRRTWLLGAGAGVVAVALCAGGWLLSSVTDGGASDGTKSSAAPPSPDDIRVDTEKTPSSPEGQMLIDYKEGGLAKTAKGDPVYAPGTWATDKVVAKGITDRIVGLTTAEKGPEKAWTLKLDGKICATSNHITVDGRTAVAVQTRKAQGATPGVCGEVVFFDVDTGRKLWQAKMPAATSATVTNTNLTLVKGTVAVAWGDGSVAYDMKTGKQLWNSTTASQCEDKGFAGGRALLVVENCVEAGDKTYRVEKLDPRTGKSRWTYKLAAGVQDVYLPSSDPPVLAVAAGDSLVTDLITLDGDGRHLATISMNGYDPKCGDRDFGLDYFGVVEHCDGVVVGRTQAYVVSKDNTAVGQAENWIVAFDLRTGRTGRKLDGRSTMPLAPIRMSGDELLVFRRSYSEVEPSAVVSWNPRTGSQRPFLLFGLPADDVGKLGDVGQTDILVEKGRVFFAKRELEAYDKYPTDPVLAVLGIGSAGLNH
ncbi:PQQ-binding-like beta-propeller repeat protein [Streptomyces sp. NPDC046197]|uniref:outer membrane protein assembly factor BamB family protein n=1 Tax=Streptomyces sp. NPDC046197 TaxID=3154337 RepID=UPI0033EFDCE0